MEEMTNVVDKEIISTKTEELKSNTNNTSEEEHSDINVDIQKQIEANKIALEKVTAVLNQKDEFTKLLSTKQSGILGGNE